MADILLVDDTESFLRLAQKILVQGGHAVTTAANGLEGLQAALRDPPEVIVSDIVMPVMNGWELCERTRCHPLTTALPFVFVTSLMDPPSRVRGLAMGADAYLQKPVSGDVLLLTVREVLARATAARGKAAQLGIGRDLGVRDLLILFRAFRKSGVVTATSPEGGRGRICFERGEALEAATDRLQGAAAIREMLGWGKSVLLIEPLPDLDVERTLDGPIDPLLFSFPAS